MKRSNVLFLVCTLSALMLAVSAQATRWDAFEAGADCSGWTVEGAIKVGGANAPYVEVPYEITLSRDGDVVDVFTGLVRAYFQMEADEFQLNESWSFDLSGGYEVAGVFTLPDVTEGESVQTFSILLDCGQTTTCDPKKPRWWKNHPDAWPVDGLEIGGRTFERDVLISKMQRCTRHRISVRLLRHLVAAKLNAEMCGHNPVADGDGFTDFAEENVTWSSLKEAFR